MTVTTNAHPMASPKGFVRGAFLFFQVMITVPIYSILYWVIFYFSTIAYAVRANNLSLLTAMVAYSTYVLLDKSPTKGGWNLSPSWQRWLRNYPGFRWLAEYFDSQLIKTKDLDPTQQYIFCYHPHGIIGIGASTMLVANGADFETHFPGIERKAVTLNAAFLVPFFRDWMLAQGVVSANKSTLKQTLESKKSIVLVAGGAAEALHTHPDTMVLYLKKRKGFVRLAMETGKPLIPCIGFGENEIFNTLVTTKADNRGWKGLLWRLQEFFMRVTSVSPPIITNPIPQPIKLSVVVGAPVEMDPKKSVDENHGMYLQQVMKLYGAHARQLGYGHVKLEIV